MTKVAIPTWLKTAPITIHLPDRTIFQPQRRIIRFNGQPYLLDIQNQRYPLAHCDQLRLEHLNGVALWITNDQPLTVFRLTTAGDTIAITDGKQKAFVRFPALTPERKAAESLAAFFNGEIANHV